MVMTTIDLDDELNQKVDLVKVYYNLKNKKAAILKMLREVKMEKLE